MTDQESAGSDVENDDGYADAFASIAIIAVVVIAVVYWLSGLPS